MRHLPLVFVTVDTEEDEWGAYDLRSPRTSNVQRLPAFQELCDRYGARPTYFANWPVANDDEAATILAELVEGGRCEIGSHIHAWNTPPFVDAHGAQHSMLCGLPADVMRAKLSSVHHLITERFGERPVTFRSGRWGLGPEVARALLELGYQVDSSVTPLMDWSAEGGPDYRKAPHSPYRFSPDRILAPDPDGALVEIPATLGFLRGDADVRMRLRERVRQSFAGSLGAVGMLDRLGVAALRWLSPELASGDDMRRLAENLVARGARVLNFTLHSPSLVPGLTPFVTSEHERERFLYRIEEFLAFAAGAGYRFEMLSRGPELLGMARREVGAGES